MAVVLLLLPACRSVAEPQPPTPAAASTGAPQMAGDQPGQQAEIAELRICLRGFPAERSPGVTDPFSSLDGWVVFGISRAPVVERALTLVSLSPEAKAEAIRVCLRHVPG